MVAQPHDDRHLEAFLAECVHESLNNYMISNAVFLCERLYAACPNEVRPRPDPPLPGPLGTPPPSTRAIPPLTPPPPPSYRHPQTNAHLLATCYYRDDKAYRAYHLLRGATSPRCRYLLARCCYDLKKHAEAESALVGPDVSKPSPLDPNPGHPVGDVPNGAAGQYLLGLVCKETGRRAAAVAHLAAALAADPFMWCAHEQLCGLGAETEAREIMTRARPDALYPPLAYLGGLAEAAPADSGEASGGAGGMEPQGAIGAIGAAATGAESTPAPMATPAAALRAPATARPPPPPLFGGVRSTIAPESAAGAVEGDLETPSGAGAGADEPTPATATASAAPVSSAAAPGSGDFITPSPAGAASQPPAPIRGGAEAGVGVSSGSSSVVASSHPGGGRGEGGRRKFVDEGKLRKVSGRLFSDPGSSAGTAGVRRSSRLASIAATPAEGGFVTPSEFGTTPRARGGRGRGRGGRDSLDGDPRDVAGGHLRPPDAPDGHANANANFNAGHGYAHAGHVGGFPPHPARTATRRDSFSSRVGAGSGRFAEGAAATLALLSPMAEAARHLASFRCREAVDALSRLPRAQFATGHALCMLGRAHAEMVEYGEAERAFARARAVDPHRLEGMEVYSTVLWHLKRETRLSHLAQETAALDRLAPQTWCVLGNCFSLQKEHETALRYFQRALQLDPRCAYAHTLCGHEYFANEDFEKAAAAYRSAIRLDSRHYNAWYGLGTVYYRQEKYELSEYHFRHALSINSRSSVLFCYLGMAQHAMGRNGEALELLQRAVALDRRNPLAKYEKASVLLSDDRFHEALEELEALKEVAPREASVFFLIGRIYKKLDMADRAMVNFSTALDLKPASGDVNLIKSAIEKLHVTDDSEEEDL